MEESLDTFNENNYDKIKIFFRRRINAYFENPIDDIKLKLEAQLAKIVNDSLRTNRPKIRIDDIKLRLKEETLIKNPPNIEKRNSTIKQPNSIKPQRTFKKKVTLPLINSNKFMSEKNFSNVKNFPDKYSTIINSNIKNSQKTNKLSLQNEVKDNKIYYYVSNGYEVIKEALKNEGYEESKDENKFHFKWVLKSSVINYKTLKPYQIVNHFQNNKEFTSKMGLCINLRSLIFKNGFDIDSFYARCYDLTDSIEFEDFLQDFKFSKAEGILKEFFKNIGIISENRLKTSIDICKKKLEYYECLIKDNNNVNSKEKYSITNKEWMIINGDTEFKDNSLTPKNKLSLKENEIISETIDYKEKTISEYKSLVSDILKQLELNDPQFNLSGHSNTWILKPSDSSRGRGIKCVRNFQELMNNISHVFNQYVVQKYIENPLIILGRKFDIRQWVVVTNFDPLEVYISEEPYIRFSAENYDPNNFGNLFSHLTNNSIVKYSKNFENSKIQGNMWFAEDFRKYLDTKFGDFTYSKIKAKINELSVICLMSCKEKILNKINCFEMYGYDFMIDEQLNPWIIEINSSPAMDYSTHVTEKLVKRDSKDLIRMIIENKIKNVKVDQVGNWKLVVKNGIKCD